MYLKTAEKLRQPVNIGVEPKQANPGVLVAALDKASSFYYMGFIRAKPATETSTLLPKGTTSRYGTAS